MITFNTHRPRARRRGMTLLEVLAVVVILGLIATTLVVSFSGAFGKAKRELARTGIGQIQQKLEIYHLEKDAWPNNDVGLKSLSDGHASRADANPRDRLCGQSTGVFGPLRRRHRSGGRRRHESHDFGLVRYLDRTDLTLTLELELEEPRAEAGPGHDDAVCT